MAQATTIRRVAGVLALGILASALFVRPAGAHVTGSLAHLTKHMKGVFYTKAQSDAAFLTPAEGDAAFLTPAEGDAAFLTPAEGDAAYQSSGCGSDPNQVMVKVGAVCIDRYEASVWSAPTGGTQYGVSSDDYPCADHAQDCVGVIYARSVAGVTPSAFITWFQAQQALANSGKRLPTNAEWQMAVAGTPDSTTCNVSSGVVAATGANAGCISDWGTNDMVGNLWEWVADWDDQADGTGVWGATYGDDVTNFGNNTTTSRFPGALIRGGHFSGGTGAGPFAAAASDRPSNSGGPFGFRGAR